MHESAADTTTGQYENLAERAVACIERHGGSLDDTRLISHVFGSTGSDKMWAPLLHSVLGADPRVTRLSNGWWTTSPPVTTGDLPSEYVVLDVETTGLKPRQHRVIEVGLIRYSGAEEPLVWSTLVDPGRRIPDYVRKITRIDDSMVATAPEFRSIGPTIREIIGDVPIVGHNVDFDIGFLNAEFARCGQPRLINVAIDTLPLADALLPNARRLALGDVARELGVPSQGEHRALADATVTAGVWQELAARAAANGWTALEQILEVTARKGRRRSPGRPVGRGRAVLDESHLRDIPHAPGVYIMRDVNDRVIYIGKAIDLRKRVGSYYSQPLGYTRKMDGLLESLAAIETTVVGSELEALVLESQLIRRYRPRFNTVQRNAEQYSYIRVDVANPWPTVTMSKDRADDGARYFGPFRSNRSARAAVQLINDSLPLRTCKRSFKNRRSLGSPCMELSLGRCSGPCMGLADPETYRGHVNLVLDFLGGNEDALLPFLHERLEASAAALDFEKAARLRDQITRANNLVLEQSRLGAVAAHGDRVLVLPGTEPGRREVWYLVNGRRWAQFTIDAETDVDDFSRRLLISRERAWSARNSLFPDHHSIDETSLLARWIQRSPEHPALIRWEEDMPANDLVEKVLAVDLTVPFGVEVDGDMRTTGAQPVAEPVAATSKKVV